eukprot:TRINITY_DN25127_c0_g3_i1.p1 TRINITY_DN25127_c0_g3~~TRINITY_DN25127_c0_g3_i1.p1  ORF type:complete len:2137 (-),score=535.43 TRINITY_DN25127_c0_g3_i1:74-6406(-)
MSWKGGYASARPPAASMSIRPMAQAGKAGKGGSPHAAAAAKGGASAKGAAAWQQTPSWQGASQQTGKAASSWQWKSTSQNDSWQSSKDQSWQATGQKSWQSDEDKSWQESGQEQSWQTGAQGWNKAGQSQGVQKYGMTAAQKAASSPARPAASAGSGPSLAPPIKKIAASTGTANSKPATGTLKVSTQKKNGMENLVIKTIVGTYSEQGENHGKKVYKKNEKDSELDVYIYFWDSRDGADYTGWWFGDQVGGTQVFARCSIGSPQPPKVGWRVPWDAPKAEPGAIVIEVVAPGASGAAGSASRPAPKAAPKLASQQAQTASSEWSARVKTATDKVEDILASSNDAIETAKAGDETQSPEDLLKLLQEQQSLLKENQTFLTSEAAAARATGPSASSAVLSLAKMATRIRNQQTATTAEINKIKGPLMKQQAADRAKKEREESQQKAKAQAEKDLQSLLPKAVEAVSAAEDAVELVSVMASPLENEPPESSEADVTKALDDIEKAVGSATAKIGQAGRAANMTSQAARKAGNSDEMKGVLEEMDALKKKLDEASKKLSPYKKFKQDMLLRIKAKKTIATFADKVTDAELEVEKAAQVLAAASPAGAGSDEKSDAKQSQDLGAVDTQLSKAKSGLLSTSNMIEQKLRTPEGQAAKAELDPILARAKECSERAKTLSGQVKALQEAAKLAQMVTQSQDKVDKAEEHVTKCEETEAPFKEGAAALDEEATTKAIKVAEDAATRAEKAIGQARGFLKQKLMDAKRLPEAQGGPVTEDINKLLKRLEDASAKLSQLSKETFERKYGSVMPDVLKLIAVAEEKVSTVSVAAEALSSPGDTADSVLREAGEKATAAEKEASQALAEAKKSLDTKIRELKGKSPGAVSQLQGRLQASNHEFARLRKLTAATEKIIKCRAALAEEEERMASAEKDVEKVKSIAESEMTSDSALEMETLATETVKLLKQSEKTLEDLVKTNSSANKDAVDAILKRSQAAAKTLSDVREKTKSKREDALCAAYVSEVEKKVKEADDLMEKASDAELPFLSGLETIPVKDSMEAIAKCDQAAADVNAHFLKTKSYMAARSLDIKRFNAPSSKDALEGIVKSQDKLKEIGERLARFKKDVQAHRRRSNLQEIAEKLTDAEETVKRASEAVKACEGEDLGNVSQEDVGKTCEEISELTASAQKVLDEMKAKMTKLQQDPNKEEGQAATLKELQGRAAGVSKDLAQATKVVSDYEQKYVAAKLLQEANAKLQSADEAVVQATEACDPILKEGGQRFLVATALRTTVDAMAQHVASQGQDLAALFKEVRGDAAGDVICQEAFVSYLEKLPRELSREDLECEERRRVDMFKYAQGESDGISEDAFKELFRKRYTVVKNISVTSDFEISGKTAGKLEVGDEVEALGEARVDENTGTSRMEVRAVQKDVTGWVTTKGNQGSVYLEVVSPFTVFTKELDKKIESAMKTATGSVSWLKSKCADLAAVGLGPLKEAIAELTKLKAKGVESQVKIEKLRKQVVSAKQDFKKKEEAEKTAHLQLKEKREVEAVLAPLRARVAEVREATAKIEEIAKPLTSLKEASEFETPLTLQEELEKVATPAQKEAAEVAAAVKEQQSSQLLGAQASKGPRLAGRKEVIELSKAVQEAITKQKSAVTGVAAACRAVGEKGKEAVIKALREEAQAGSLTPEALFEKLAAGSSSISEDAFLKHVESLGSTDVKPEGLRLACRRIQGGPIGQRRFLEMLQTYYIVVKEIAITTSFDIGKDKPIRKSETNEVFQLLEGPNTNEEAGMQRIKARSLKDGLEGWITLSGNKGTPFLKETPKPYYACNREVPLQADADGKGDAVRQLKPEEILEVLEGPKKVEAAFPDVLRARVKASKDAAAGFLTVRDQTGTVFAEASDRHYVVATATGLTDDFDMSKGKLLRKLAVGEIFEALDEPQEEEEKGIKRVKAKTLKDDLVGWIAITGAKAATIYAKLSTKHYIVKTEASLSKRAAGDGQDVRTLQEGEVVEVLAGPNSEKVEAPSLIKCRSLGDEAVGWVLLASARPCKPFYKCKKAVSLRETAASDAPVIRQLVADEQVELVDRVEEAEDGVLQLKGRAERDGAVGWISIRDKKGTFLAAA